MTCMGQRSGRFTFKSGRGNSEIYAASGGSSARRLRNTRRGRGVSRNFSLATGPFLFSKKGSSVRSNRSNRPLAHLLLDNLQKFDETLEVAAVTPTNERQTNRNQIASDFASAGELEEIA